MKDNQQLSKDKRLQALKAIVKMNSQGKKAEAKILMHMLYSK